MEKVEINIGFSENWHELIIGDINITDLEIAINIIKVSNIGNVQLRQNGLFSVMEWDNF